MDEIFYLMENGGGGFSYFDCYNMPIQVRKYNVRKLFHNMQEKNERAEAAKETGKGNLSMQQLATGNADKFKNGSKAPPTPYYTAKAPKRKGS